MKRNMGIYRYGLGRSLLNYSKDAKRYGYEVSFDYMVRTMKMIESKKPFKFLN